ncbi:hypothetical protein [Prosthecomicrobium hirschii]|uniref:Uncharacterized protein n=1 Tax=Prosthecodimorpha hirschii TaxID=665126 RepID=A0A0P6VR51_9HYPH|nr:hypothetical protein [Prosthecomicrobium hirschii]KPL55244.1 hypothetical protein ABB55_25910 [Prosthecomicrobium hirschii]MCW1839811.1 hypothetical protein [Prosthecomicrobium hirschii]TPQ50329.1 hypothetical protein C2U72_14020 [Prosthecomicrobium hirschii]
MRLVLAALLALAVLPAAPAASAQSCSGFQSMCAARCKQRAPTDLNCVQDHCTPKLQECRATGCWQEGKLYGGAKTCNLKKT